MSGKRYPEEVKDRARQLRAEGLTYKRIGELLGTNHRRVRAWVTGVSNSSKHKGDWRARHLDHTRAYGRHYDKYRRGRNESPYYRFLRELRSGKRV